MDCLLCKETITSPGTEATSVPDNFVRQHVPGYQEPIRVGFIPKWVHLACITDPNGLNGDSFNKWLLHRLDRIEAWIKAHQEAVQREFELIHRAIHALPSELNAEYMKEIYEDNGGNGTASGSPRP
jgi:hypothetical protein